MAHFITFSYPDQRTRVSVRIELGGDTVVVVTDHAGLMIDRRVGGIDPRDARRLIEDVFAFAPQLPNRDDGYIFVSIGDGADRRDYVVTEYDLPHRGLEVGRIIRSIAIDLRAGYQVRSRRSVGGPQAPGMTLGSFIGWSLAFSIGFVASVIVGNIGLIVGALSGPYLFAISNTVAILLMAGSFYSIGQKFGEQYRGLSSVWLPAIAGTLPFIYLWMKVAGPGSFFSLIFMCLMPLVAYHGDRTGY